jgi:phytoene dehydrogenase-like protein
MDHYFEGGFYPMGGGAGIVKAMVNTFKRHGGEIRTRQCVKKIIIQDNRAIAVELEDGRKISAKTIVSNADPTATYLGLVGKENISTRLARRLSQTKYSVTSLILFLTLDMDVRMAGVDSGNIWMLNGQDLDKIYYELIDRNILEGAVFPAVFISCTTLKDPASFNGSYHNLEVVTYISYDSFSAFDSNKDYHGDVYAGHKEKIIEKLMNNVEKAIPGAKDHVVQMELGTPKTNQYYINSTNGNVYGTEKSLNQIGPFSYKNKSEISGLYLCGASTLSHGVGGATHSGIEAAARILQCRPKDLLIPDKNQNLRIYDAEDPSTWPDWVSQKLADRKRRFGTLH